MHNAVRADEDYVCVLGRYVSEGQGIAPGAPLLEVMTPDGMVRTIMSQCWGIIAHIEGELISSAALEFPELADNVNYREDSDDSESSNVIYLRDNVLCHIAERGQGAGGVRDGKLHPRNAPSARYRRLNGLSRG